MQSHRVNRSPEPWSPSGPSRSGLRCPRPSGSSRTPVTASACTSCGWRSPKVPPMPRSASCGASATRWCGGSRRRSPSSRRRGCPWAPPNEPGSRAADGGPCEEDRHPWSYACATIGPCGRLTLVEDQRGFEELTLEIATTLFVAAALRLATGDGPLRDRLFVAYGSGTIDVMRFVHELPGPFVDRITALHDRLTGGAAPGGDGEQVALSETLATMTRDGIDRLRKADLLPGGRPHLPDVPQQARQARRRLTPKPRIARTSRPTGVRSIRWPLQTTPSPSSRRRTDSRSSATNSRVRTSTPSTRSSTPSAPTGRRWR